MKREMLHCLRPVHRICAQSYAGVAGNKLTCRLATGGDSERISRFLVEHFCHTEPTNRAIGLDGVGAKLLMDMCVSDTLAHPISYVVHPCGEPAELVAVSLNTFYDFDAGDAFGERAAAHTDAQWRALVPDAKARAICAYLEHVDAHVRHLMPATCRRLFKFNVVNVRADHMRRGIATMMWRRSMEAVAAMRAHGLYTQATALATQNMYGAMQFDILKIVHHKYYLDANGERIFKCDDGTECAIAFFKPAM